MWKYAFQKKICDIFLQVLLLIIVFFVILLIMLLKMLEMTSKTGCSLYDILGL